MECFFDEACRQALNLFNAHHGIKCEVHNTYHAAEVVDVDTVRHLECPITHDVLSRDDAVRIPCCGLPFERHWLKENSSRTSKCPCCKEDFDFDKVYEDKLLQRMIEDIKVFCPLKAKGCQWTGFLDSVRYHLVEQCDFVILACHSAECGCEAKGDRAFMTKHEATCKLTEKQDVTFFIKANVKLHAATIALLEENQKNLEMRLEKLLQKHSQEKAHNEQNQQMLKTSTQDQDVQTKHENAHKQNEQLEQLNTSSRDTQSYPKHKATQQETTTQQKNAVSQDSEDTQVLNTYAIVKCEKEWEKKFVAAKAKMEELKAKFLKMEHFVMELKQWQSSQFEQLRGCIQKLEEFSSALANQQRDTQHYWVGEGRVTAASRFSVGQTRRVSFSSGNV